MVAMIEIASLFLLVILGVWWFRRTNLYRAHRRSPGVPGQHGYGWGSEGMYTHRALPNRQSHRE
jgi:ABC-type nickel/cobalt efflux system permease component RcnA